MSGEDQKFRAFRCFRLFVVQMLSLTHQTPCDFIGIESSLTVKSYNFISVKK